MESYIEVTYINNVLIGIFAYYASSYFSMSKMSHRFFYVFLLCEQLVIVLLFNKAMYPLFYLLEYTLTLWLFYHQYKKLLMYLCIKYLAFFTMFKFFNGSFHLLHYFVPSHINILGIWILLLFGIVVLHQKYAAYLKVSDFIYSLTIEANKPIHVKGFLDTGNQVMWKKHAVLFLDHAYLSYFKECLKEQVVVHTLNKTEVLSCYLCKVKINRYKKGEYYICCDKRVALEWGCKCLLNMEI